MLRGHLAPLGDNRKLLSRHRIVDVARKVVDWFCACIAGLLRVPSLSRPRPHPVHDGRTNRAWVTEITYIRTYEGFLHLAVVLDLFSRQAVGRAPAPFFGSKQPVHERRLAKLSEGTRHRAQHEPARELPR